MEIEKPKKDMKTVRDYENKRKIEIFRGQCFNASVSLAAMFRVSPKNTRDISEIYDLAEALFEEGMGRNYLRLEVD